MLCRKKLISTDIEWELRNVQMSKRWNNFHLRGTILNQLLFEENT